MDNILVGKTIFSRFLIPHEWSQYSGLGGYFKTVGLHIMSGYIIFSHRHSGFICGLTRSIYPAG